MICSNPPTKLGLESMLEVMPEGTPWGVSLMGASLFDTILPHALSLGGNISIGLGDYGYPELGEVDNGALVRKAVEYIERSGRTLATKEETRKIYGLHEQ